MRHIRQSALLVSVVAALALASVHQALTESAKKTLVVLSSADVIGYVGPCG